VIGFPHEIKGEWICAFCVPKAEVDKVILDSVSKCLGNFAKLDKVLLLY
jgi:acyl-coenzyme A synthetase/AMP-(fatty) acid ligase